MEWSINLGITSDELVQVIDEAATGTLEESAVAEEWEASDYVGQTAGLSRREADVLALVAQGHSNNEIADMLFLSINSVKTYPLDLPEVRRDEPLAGRCLGDPARHPRGR